MRLPQLRWPPVRRSVLINAGLVAVIVGGGYWANVLINGSAEPAAAAPSTTGTRTAAVTEGSVVLTASASGAVESATTASADFVTSGTVTSISVKVGDTVKKGAVLARVDPTEAQADLDTAEANLDAAKASLTRAQASSDDAAVTSAQAQLTSAQGTVDAAETALAGTVLKAPMAGTVTAVNGSVGGSSGSSSGFVALADLTSLQVSASFAEADATKLKAGQVATVTWSAMASATADGKVTTISPTASTTNNVNSYAVTVSLATLPDGVRIGQTVTVLVTVAQVDNVVRVPAAAVKSAGGKHTVTVVTNGQSQVTPVEIGIEGNSFTEITSGLIAGQQVELVVTSTTTTTNGGELGGGGGGFGGGGTGGGPPGGTGTTR